MDNILSQLESLHSPHKVVARDASQSLTTEMLVDGCKGLAGELDVRSIKVLALHGDNSTSWMVIDIACQLAGVCLIPIPTFFSTKQIDPTYSCAVA
jgi:long-chain acyl-CoA synthetase